MRTSNNRHSGYLVRHSGLDPESPPAQTTADKKRAKTQRFLAFWWTIVRNDSRGSRTFALFCYVCGVDKTQTNYEKLTQSSQVHRPDGRLRIQEELQGVRQKAPHHPTASFNRHSPT